MQDKKLDQKAPVYKTPWKRLPVIDYHMKLAIEKAMTSARRHKRRRKGDPRRKLNEMSMSDLERLHTSDLKASSAAQQFRAESRRPELGMTATF